MNTNPRYQKLLEPGRIGQMKLRNRIVFPAIGSAPDCLLYVKHRDRANIQLAVIWSSRAMSEIVEAQAGANISAHLYVHFLSK